MLSILTAGYSRPFLSIWKAKTSFTLFYYAISCYADSDTVAERAVKFSASTSNFVIYLKQQPQCCSVKIMQCISVLHFSSHRVLGSSLEAEILIVWGAWCGTLHEPHQHTAERPEDNNIGNFQKRRNGIALTGWRLGKLRLNSQLDHSVSISCGAQRASWC